MKMIIADWVQYQEKEKKEGGSVKKENFKQEMNFPPSYPFHVVIPPQIQYKTTTLSLPPQEGNTDKQK